ncbi:rhamnogalacturonan lyase family protein [Bacillus sp. OTU2372]|uniref:rhamnogalacturonan lyase family protein n=1 Tax=Bacillus sp. OTU2372 TaxID=3043858 RepID=UPI00313B6D2B
MFNCLRKHSQEWTFDSAKEGRGGSLGFHNLATGDVDNDGFDEIFTGSLTLDQAAAISMLRTVIWGANKALMVTLHILGHLILTAKDLVSLKFMKFRLLPLRSSMTGQQGKP